MKLGHEGWDCWGRGAGVTPAAVGRILHRHGGLGYMCMAAMGKTEGVLSGIQWESGSRDIGRCQSFQNPLWEMLASVLLFLKPDERNCCLSCSLSCCLPPGTLLVTVITTAIYVAHSVPGCQNRGSESRHMLVQHVRAHKWQS